VTSLELHFKGDSLAATITPFMDDLVARGHRVAMADPATVAGGDGWIEIEVRGAEREEAEAIVRAAIDQAPGLNDMLVGGDLSDGGDLSGRPS
jgi:hypothetical protein